MATDALINDLASDAQGARSPRFPHQKAVAIVGSVPYGKFLIEQIRARPEAGFMPLVVYTEDGAHNRRRDDPTVRSRCSR